MISYPENRPVHVGLEPGSPRRLCFVGVSTGGSSIMDLFPVWAELLGLDAEVVGWDLPLDAPPEAYRDCVRRLATEDAVSGALVTTHKSAVYEHARDMFDELDDYATLCREVSCVARRGERLLGWAKDPITAGLALEHLLGPDHWKATGRHVICFGAGGAGLAIAAHLLSGAERPDRIVLIDRDPRRVELAHELGAQLGAGDTLECLGGDDTGANDRLVSDSPEGTLVINATGMGKDRPGSPISAAARLPHGSVAWDLNYRGELDFLRIAKRQDGIDGVRVADGWRYFLHGWTEVIAEVFDIELTPERFEELAQAAAAHTRRESLDEV
jgi:shikimate dehydrogenase